MIKLSSNLKKFKPFLFEELYRKERAEKTKGKKVISMAVGDPDIPTHPDIVEFAIKEIQNAINHRYPNTKGNQNLREAIARWHKRRHGIDFHPYDDISISIGSKEAIAHLPFAVMEKKDICLIPDPTYPTYRTGVLLSGGQIYDVPIKEENNFLVDLAKIPQKIVNRTSLFFLNYPNNPTGAAADKNFYKELVKWAIKNDVIIALDAAYCEIYFDQPTSSIFEIPQAKKIAVEFYSASKTYCMAGWRIGWAIGNSKIVCALNQIKENIDSGQFNAIQNTLAYALDNHDRIVPAIREKFKERADFFSKALVEYGWKIVKPGGSCFIWAKTPVKCDSEDAAVFLLENADVLAAPGSGFGKNGQGYLRFSLTLEDELIKEAAEKIQNLDWSKI